MNRQENNEQWDRMISGEIYDAADPALIEKLIRTKRLIARYNTLDPADEPAREAMLRDIIGTTGKGIFIVQPFYCDYGENIHVGDGFFANFNFTVLDEAPVTIGRNAFIGPNVGIYTACHPTDPDERMSRREWALPVTIGDDVWIGGGVTILPGVTIGSGTTIGAGSVVTKDIPARCVAAGNPCRVIKKL